MIAQGWYSCSVQAPGGHRIGDALAETKGNAALGHMALLLVNHSTGKKHRELTVPRD